MRHQAQGFPQALVAIVLERSSQPEGIAGSVARDPDCRHGEQGEDVNLAGTYRLIRYEIRWSDGRVELPYGEDAEGLLVYTPTGHMSGHLMRRDVPRFRTSARHASSEETRAAYLGYLGYYGTFTVDETVGTVNHRVLGSWHPNWIGTNQLRYFELEGDRLILQTPPRISGDRSRHSRLIWQRVSLP